MSRGDTKVAFQLLAAIHLRHATLLPNLTCVQRLRQIVGQQSSFTCASSYNMVYDAPLLVTVNPPSPHLPPRSFDL